MPPVRIERFVAGGEGLARADDGRVVFVRGGVPGDLVEVSVIDERRDWMRAVVDQVLEPSADRREASCPSRRAGCGGCDWGEVRPEVGLAHKVAVVVEALRRTARIDVPVTAGGSVPTRGYRTTIRVVGGLDGRAAFRRAADHDTVDASPCEVAHPLLVDTLADLRLTPGVEVQLRCSVATGEVAARWDRRAGRIDGLGPGVATGADATIHEDVAGHRLRVSAAAFFQSGPAAAALLVESVRRLAPELAAADRVVDAYGGVGLFAATCAPSTAEVTLIETSRAAVADAAVNLAGRAGPVDVVRSEVGAWRDRAGASAVDVVIADPARSGLGRPGVAALTRPRAPVLVLISCDPVSFARDAGLLSAAGLGLDAVEVLDLFPGTHHVETVSVWRDRSRLSP
jgi:23S rRNA (uracil1939-C5)-methyltransferase